MPIVLPYPYPELLTDTYDVRQIQDNFAALAAAASTGAADSGAARVVYSKTWNFSNVSGATTAEIVVASVVIPSSSLSGVGDVLHASAMFYTAANTGLKTFRIYANSTIVGNTGINVINNAMGTVDAWVGRSSVNATSQIGIGVAVWSANNASGVPVRRTVTKTMTENLANPMTISFTMQNGVARSGDCTMFGLHIDTTKRRK